MLHKIFGSMSGSGIGRYDDFLKVFNAPSIESRNSRVQLCKTTDRRHREVQTLFQYDITVSVEKHNEILEEIKKWRSLDESTLCELDGVFQKSEMNESDQLALRSYFFLTKHESFKTLQEYKEEVGTILPIDKIKEWFVDLVHTVHNLHENGLVHRNINDTSVLLDQNNSLKLTQPGYGFDEIIQFLDDTDLYIDPVVFDEEEGGGLQFTVHSDVFSLGAVFFSILCDFDPEGEVLDEYLENEDDESFIELIEQCRSEDIEDRPDLSSLYEKCKSMFPSHLEKVTKKKPFERKFKREEKETKVIRKVVRRKKKPKPKPVATKPAPPAPPSFLGKIARRKEKEGLEGEMPMKKMSFERKVMKKKAYDSESDDDEEEEDSESDEESDDDSDEEEEKKEEKEEVYYEMEKKKKKKKKKKKVEKKKKEKEVLPQKRGKKMKKKMEAPKPKKKKKARKKKKKMKKKEEAFHFDEYSKGSKMLDMDLEMEDEIPQKSAAPMMNYAMKQALPSQPSPGMGGGGGRPMLGSGFDRSGEAQPRIGAAHPEPEMGEDLEMGAVSFPKRGGGLDPSRGIKRLCFCCFGILCLPCLLPFCFFRYIEESNRVAEEWGLSERRKEYDSQQEQQSGIHEEGISQGGSDSSSSEEEIVVEEVVEVTEPTEETTIPLHLDQYQDGLERKKSYEVKSVIGQGGQSSVYLVELKSKPGIQCTMKRYKNGTLDEFKAEVKALKDLCLVKKEQNSNNNQSYIVQYVEDFGYTDEYGEECRFIIMEYCEQGDLQKVMRKKLRVIKKKKLKERKERMKKLKEQTSSSDSPKIIAKRKRGGRRKGVVVHLETSEIFTLISMLVHGINEVHSQNYVHHDIKSPNVFITKDSMVRIGDFGFAILETEVFPGGVSGGTLKYMSPEAKEGGVGKKYLDVWSLGTLIVEIIMSKVIDFKLKGSHEERKKFLENEVWLFSSSKNEEEEEEMEELEEEDKEGGVELLEMVIRCFDEDVSKRITAGELKEGVERIVKMREGQKVKKKEEEEVEGENETVETN